MARSFHILSLILILGVSVLFNCVVPEEPEPEIDLAKGPEKPPMDLDKPPPEEVSLIERMGYEDKDVRYAAYDELIAMGEDAVPLLVEGLKHEEPGIRNASASTLGKIGPDAVGAAPALIEALDDEFSQIRITAAQAIGKIGPGAAEAIPALIEKLQTDRHALHLEIICTSLAQLKPDSIPWLIELLESDDNGLVYWAIESLELIGPDAKDAVGPLVKLMRHEPPGETTLFLPIGKALASIGAEYSLRPILDLLEDETETLGTRMSVLTVTANLFSDSEEALHVVLDLVDHDDVNLRGSAIGVLAQFQGYPEIVVPKLIDILDDPSMDGWGLAIYVLGKFGRDAVEAVPALIKIYESNPADLQWNAKGALKVIGINPEAKITQFEQLLEDESPIIRRTAAYLLGQKGKEAEYVLPKLKGLSESDPDDEVREYAQSAIDKIEAALNEE